MKNFLIATAAVFIVTHANAGGYFNPKTGNYEMPPPKTTMEKNIPSDFFGEWCYVGDNGNGGSIIDYQAGLSQDCATGRTHF